MKFGTLLAGILLGGFFSNPKNRELLNSTLIKGAGYITDTLSKTNGGVENVPTTNTDSATEE